MVDSGFIIAFDVVPIGVTPFAFQSITTTATTTTPVPQTTTTRALDLIEQDLFRVCEDTEIKDTLAGVVLSHDAFGSNSKSLRQTCTLAIQPDDSCSFVHVFLAELICEGTCQVVLNAWNGINASVPLLHELVLPSWFFFFFPLKGFA